MGAPGTKGQRRHLRANGTAVASNLWAEKPVAITLPDDLGTVGAVVRRFLDDAEGGHPSARWAVELAGLTFVQRARWARFVFIAARLERDGGPGSLPGSSV